MVLNWSWLYQVSYSMVVGGLEDVWKNYIGRQTDETDEVMGHSVLKTD